MTKRTIMARKLSKGQLNKLVIKRAKKEFKAVLTAIFQNGQTQSKTKTT